MPGRPMRLYVQDIEHGDPRLISDEGIEASYVDRIAPSPDGRFVAAVGPSHTCMLFPVAGGTPRPIPGLAEAEFLMPADPTGLDVIGTVTLAPDGESYAYASGTTFSQLVAADGIR